jgi:hypothetical protein
MNNKTVVAIFVLVILALSVFAMIQILPVKAVGSCTLSDTYLMSADFGYRWNGPPGTFVTKTDISGPGVQFDFTDLGKVAMGDDYPVAQGAGGALYDGHYSDFSGYWGYSVLFVNQGPDTIEVHLFMNTGFTSSPHTAAEDTFWASNWISLAKDQRAIVTLDFSSCGQVYHADDDPVPEWRHDDGTGGWPVQRLQEVTGIGFEVIDSGSASASVIVSGDLAHLYIDPPAVNKAPGDPDFTVAVTLSNFANLYGFEIKLTWNNTLITFVSADKTPLNTLWPAIPPETSGWAVILETSGAGFYRLAVSSIGSVASNAGASVLFRVTFHIAKSCNFPLSTPIHFDVVKLVDNGTPTPNPIPATVTDGMYYISGTIPDLEIVVVPAPGGHGPPFEYCDNFELEVWVTHICPDSPLRDYTIVIQYDANLATHLAKYLDVDRWSSFGTGTAAEAPLGTITVSCTGGPQSGDRFLLFALTFHVEFGFGDAHIWKKGLPNYETFPISLVDATLSFGVLGNIPKTGITMPGPVTIQVDFIRGDVNCDGKVDIDDISSAAFYYDKKLGDPDWDTAKKYDLNDDKVIDIFDIVSIATKYGYGTPGNPH